MYLMSQGFAITWIETSSKGVTWATTIVVVWTWASSQIRKIAGCACAWNAGNVFLAIAFKGNRGLAIQACITAGAGPHVPWCMPGSLTHGVGENVPGNFGACATHNCTYLARGPCISCLVLTGPGVNPNPASASPSHKRDKNLVIILPVHILATDGTRPPAGMIRNTRRHVSSNFHVTLIGNFQYISVNQRTLFKTIGEISWALSLILPYLTRDSGRWAQGGGFAWGPLYKHDLTEIRTWVSNQINCFMWDVITHPWHNFNRR